MRSRVTVVLALAAALLLFRAGSLSWTWDESIDMSIVSCVQTTGDPNRCLEDISQTRLPIYLHAAVSALTSWDGAHYLLSAAFALVNLVLLHSFARRRFGARTAMLALVLAATAPSLLASGRMLLSHANVIFTTFSLVCVLSYERFDEEGRVRYFWISAIAGGLALACSMLGLFLLPMIVGLWLFGSRPLRRWQPVAYAAVTVAVFFVTTVIYLRPSNLAALIDATVSPHTYPYPLWNYLGLGSNLAPRWYSPLLFAIRLGPWWAALFLVSPLMVLRGMSERRERRALFVIWAGSAAYLLGKSAFFRYDAPHQQAPWYPLVFVFVAATIVRLIDLAKATKVRWAAPAAASVVVGLVVLQLYDTQRFFPNYLFYGAQYGEAFIGEFYGPAVLHKQGRAEIDADIAALVAAQPEARILMADNNGFEVKGDHFVPFTRRDPAETYEFALADRLHTTHLHHAERDAYVELLRRDYRVYRSLDYPLDEWAYRIYELRPVARGRPTAPNGSVEASTSSSPPTTR